MSEIITVGLDLAKNVFQVHGADGAGRAVLRKKLRRMQVLEFFSQLAPCVVAMEACGGAHFWGREIRKLGHDVRLIPPAYVKPFVKRQKNDAADAEAICEAAVRPTMRFVPVKSEEVQGAAMVFRVRVLLIRQRTQLPSISGKSPLAGAIRYALTRMARLRPYLDHGILELDNNTAERAMRSVAIGRKNYLFVGSQTGGKAAAIAYTLIETAKLNDIDPQAWLADTLARIPDYKINRVNDLLPWKTAQ